MSTRLTVMTRQSARKYVEFILRYYPPGSFDFREWVSGLEAQVNGIRRDNLIRAMQTFPKRRFILLGDTSNSDAMSDYADMVRLFPGQVQVRETMPFATVLVIIC